MTEYPGSDESRVRAALADPAFDAVTSSDALLRGVHRRAEVLRGRRRRRATVGSAFAVVVVAVGIGWLADDRDPAPQDVRPATPSSSVSVSPVRPPVLPPAPVPEISSTVPPPPEPVDPASATVEPPSPSPT